MANNNIRSTLFYGDQWNATPSYERVEVKSSWGLADEGSALGVSSCTLQLDNRSGDYAPDDARSALFGQIGRNTPGRLALLPGYTSGEQSDTVDAFGRTVAAGGWGSTDSGEAWTVLAPVAGSAADFAVSGGVGTHSLATGDSASPRQSVLESISVTDADVAVTVTAPQATGASLYFLILFRGDPDDLTSYFRARVELTTANAVNLAVVAREGANLGSTTVSGLTHTGTGQPLRLRALAAGNRIHMKIWAASGTEPDAWQLVVVDTDRDSSEVPLSGWIGLSSVRATGNTNSTTPQFSYDDWESTTYIPIADGSVSKWEPDRDAGYDTETHEGGDSWTDIEITGPSERVNSSKGSLSAIRRSFLAAQPEAYWPLEDPEGTTAPLSGLQGGAPGFIKSGSAAFGVTPDNLVSASVSQLDAYTTTGLLEFPLDGFADGAIYVELVAGALSGVAADMLVEIVTSSNDHWFATAFSSDVGDGAMHHFALYAVENGANVDYVLWKDGAVESAFPIAGDVGTPLALRIGGSITSGGSGSTWYVSHLAAWQTEQDPTERGLCGVGYRSETPPNRFLRLCSEHGIAGGVNGDVDLGANPMGVQQPDTLANLFVECAATDLGLVGDGRGWNGLEFRTGRSLSNQSVALALTYGVNVAPPVKPVTDNLGIANDITANDRSGATARASKDSGPLNTSDPFTDPEGVGRTEGSVDVNVQNPSQLDDIAGWNLLTSTIVGARYRQITIDLSKHPELLPACMALKSGDLITVDGLDADTVELLVLGGEHSLVMFHHELVLNCAPAGPYRVATVGSTSEFSRIGSSSSSLGADFTPGTDTALSVAVTGPRWSTTAPPFHIRVGGVVLNVTAITGGAELATVGTAAHADNAAITPGMPANVAVSDAMLLWACCRNTALTAPTVTGWTNILTVGQGALYFKRATVTGGGSAPTITYAGTAAGDTVSGQISRWRQLDPGSLDTSSGVQSNASAQDIAVPALGRPGSQNCLVLLLAWKQDDITGLTPPTGFTEIDRLSTTTGSDQFMYWAYALQSDREPVAASTITITGGASAISKAILVAFDGWQTFTVDATPVNGVTSRILRTTDSDALKRVELEHPVYIGA